MLQLNLLIGTNKGIYRYETDEARRDWQLFGPFLPGWEVYSLLGKGPKLFAGTSHYVYGPTVRVSDDLGATWTEVEASPRYDANQGFKLRRIWQLAPGVTEGTLYAGVEEAGLFKSEDDGQTWRELRGLSQHPSRPGWFPGGGGLCLHTILPHPGDPQRLWVAMSAVGAFRSDDGGESWRTCNAGLPEVATGQPYPEVGRCVHKMVLDPDDPDTLYLQFHWGVFKSQDAGESWTPIEAGLPGTFGFPMVMTRSGALFTLPLESDEHRVVAGGRLRVFRSRDRGESWHDASAGLPEEPQFVGVLRDAMASDPLEPAGVYFGTTAGDVYASADSGESWTRLPGTLPRITAVKTWLREA